MSASPGPDAAACAPPATRLRRREDADLAEMLDLWVASWRAAYPEIDFDARRDWLTQQIAALEAKGAATLCIFDGSGERLAGFVVIDPETGWLDQICVGPAYQGDGYADALMAAARALSQGVIRLDVNADNMRAIRFYERRGFAEIGRGANTLSGRKTIMMEWRAAE
ncbi:GNAT family N-acetyltransferase [Methylocystis sp. JR02]|uniref:GNAT family N-acetyltransferase n=1 Tax=Methylocystis sp. JR02 TaxID=3046284 RepID=UPI0024BA7084|nr:GNAT family N-acetyltransferase [Methylocystis sp. JR02]MDJ0448144.1 GNAT family N-acetyltransferase [Methylocystis sp. JR02]